MKCIPCRVTFNGQRYFVASDGQVYPTWQNIGTIGQGNTWSLGAALDREPAAAVRREARRQRRNRNARDRDQARRDLGLVKTPYGWE